MDLIFINKKFFFLKILLKKIISTYAELLDFNNGLDFIQMVMLALRLCSRGFHWAFQKKLCRVDKFLIKS
jgi:hypothetical protein